jgi:hypothetical protein
MKIERIWSFGSYSALCCYLNAFLYFCSCSNQASELESTTCLKSPNSLETTPAYHIVHISDLGIDFNKLLLQEPMGPCNCTDGPMTNVSKLAANETLQNEPKESTSTNADPSSKSSALKATSKESYQTIVIPKDSIYPQKVWLDHYQREQQRKIAYLKAYNLDSELQGKLDEFEKQISELLENNELVSQDGSGSISKTQNSSLLSFNGTLPASDATSGSRNSSTCRDTCETNSNISLSSRVMAMVRAATERATQILQQNGNHTVALIWTGGHRREQEEASLIRTIIRSCPDMMMRLDELIVGILTGLTKSLHSIPIVYSIGPYDTFEPFRLPAGPNANLDFLTELWKAAIPTEQLSIFRQGGYYAVDIIRNSTLNPEAPLAPDTNGTALGSGKDAVNVTIIAPKKNDANSSTDKDEDTNIMRIRIISLNTYYFAKSNDLVCDCDDFESPGRKQLLWLNNQLVDAAEKGMTAYIVGHLAPSRDTYKPACYRGYMRLLQDFGQSSVVSADSEGNRIIPEALDDGIESVSEGLQLSAAIPRKFAPRVTGQFFDRVHRCYSSTPMRKRRCGKAHKRSLVRKCPQRSRYMQASSLVKPVKVSRNFDNRISILKNQCNGPVKSRLDDLSYDTDIANVLLLPNMMRKRKCKRSTSFPRGCHTSGLSLQVSNSSASTNTTNITTSLNATYIKNYTMEIQNLTLDNITAGNSSSASQASLFNTTNTTLPYSNSTVQNTTLKNSTASLNQSLDNSTSNSTKSPLVSDSSIKEDPPTTTMISNSSTSIKGQNMSFKSNETISIDQEQVKEQPTKKPEIIVSKLTLPEALSPPVDMNGAEHNVLENLISDTMQSFFGPRSDADIGPKACECLNSYISKRSRRNSRDDADYLPRGLEAQEPRRWYNNVARSLSISYPTCANEELGDKTEYSVPSAQFIVVPTIRELPTIFPTRLSGKRNRNLSSPYADLLNLGPNCQRSRSCKAKRASKLCNEKPENLSLRKKKVKSTAFDKQRRRIMNPSFSILDMDLDGDW